MPAAPMRTYQLPAPLLDEIFSGPVSTQSVGWLRESQYSLRRLRLAGLFDQISASPEYKPAVEFLSVVDLFRPDIVADILLHPPVGVWLARVLRPQPELDYLNSLAASAAIRAEWPVEIDIPAWAGFAALPAVGVVATQDSTHTVRGNSADLIPLARHRIDANGVSLDIQLDDSDRYREFENPLPPKPLGTDQLAAWSRLLDDTWDVLTERHGRYAMELSAVLRTLIPITSGSGICGASSTAAFGGIAVSMKDSPVHLARAVIHECQHSKFNALLDLVTLVEHDSGDRWYVPWRDDLRPLTGVLHGIYAFMCDVEFWLVELEHVRDAKQLRDASVAFALRRRQVRDVLTSLESAKELTDLGRRLVDVAHERISICESVAVPADILRDVARMMDVDRVKRQRRSD